jgi:hypothetical protein
MPGSIAYTIPDLTTQGPQYAQLIDTALAAIQTHVHDGVNAGALIDIAIQQCKEDLSVESHNVTNVRSVELNNNPAQLIGSQDVNCLYVNQGNLGFNNDDGIFIPLTDGNQIATGVAPLLNWTMRTTITASFSILYTDLYNFIPIDTAGGAITGTLPIAAQIVAPAGAAGRIFVFKDVTGHAATHPITIQVAPASGNTFGDSGATSFVINNNYGYVAIYVDAGLAKWLIWDADVWQNQTIQINAASTLKVNDSTIALVTGSNLTIDATSAATVTGGTTTFSGGTVHFENAATVTVQDTSTVTYQGSAGETFASGTTLSIASGAVLGVESGGILELTGGSTTLSSGTLDIAGTTTISGTGTTLSGTMHVTGTVTYASGHETFDVNSAYTNNGLTNLFGETWNVQLLGAGSYTCDSTPGHYDRVIGLQLAATGTWSVTLPASPVAGRLITILDVSGQDVSSATYTVNIVGNGLNILNWPQVGAGSGTTGGSRATQSITTSGAPENLCGGWSITLIAANGVWAVVDTTIGIY